MPLVAAALLLLGIAMMWLIPDVRFGALSAALGDSAPAPGQAVYTWRSAIVPLALLSLPALVFAWTMWMLNRLFSRMAKGIVLDAHNARLVSQSGLGFAAFGVLAVIGNTLAVLVLTASNAPGERVLSISFSAASLGALAAGFAFWGLGAVLAEAARVAEEHAGIL
ncbi:MAG: hypothetical protein AAF739_03960 [Pseudomonadota bacterium]